MKQDRYITKKKTELTVCTNMIYIDQHNN